uniref:Uncharacterized protein n=1 Tax=Escherichia coli TaxID=562 RepID=C1J8G3_ECOLX|nr:hypothetical protein [Escherichia coli]
MVTRKYLYSFSIFRQLLVVLHMISGDDHYLLSAIYYFQRPVTVSPGGAGYSESPSLKVYLQDQSVPLPDDSV